MTATQLAGALVAQGTVTVSLTKPHDPDAFYRNRPGLYVYEDFHKRVVADAMPTESAPPVILRRFVFDREGGANDGNMEYGLGADHEFTESEVCWIIAEMIAKQPKGEPGDLEISAKANLFYIPSLVVDVSLYRPHRMWHVRTWDRGVGVGWLLGGSAFSRH